MDDKARARHAAHHRRGLVQRAAKGDADAGRAMLQHAMAAMRRAAAGADEADAVALLWMADALALSFTGVTLDRAAGLERAAGRPAHSETRKVVEAVPIWRAVNDLATKLQAEGAPAPKRTAQERVAKRTGKSASTIRAACALIVGLSLEDEPTE
jgi:hypothetical protein